MGTIADSFASGRRFGRPLRVFLKKPTFDPGAAKSVALEPVIESAETRRSRSLPKREWAVEGAATFALVGVVATLALALPSQRAFELGPALALTAAYAIAARVRFVAGAGYADPCEVVFVPILLLVPLPLVPVVVAAGLIASRISELARGRVSVTHVLSFAAGAWFSVAPVLVVAAAAPGAPAWSHVPVYVLALVAQLGSDSVVSTLREWLAAGVPPRLHFTVMLRVWMVDSLLWPIGLLAALTAAGHPYRALLVLPLVGVLAVFAEERAAHVKSVLELSRAYRGTALLLGDVLEDKDSYTASHSHGVVDMSLRVGAELGLDPAAQRRLEFGALLHDIGKLNVPVDIINKPGPLDGREWGVMKLHTIEGQQMLERVGGMLAEVGVIVRASHEHWDGSGYPDGLAGEDIPIEARIIAACDALSAMTTDRSYRSAMSFEEATIELQVHAGTQFDPHVVATLLGLLESANGPRRTLGRRPSRAAA